MAAKPPTAKIVRNSEVSTTWLIQWPSTIYKAGKSYYATTYPGSDHVFMETAAKRRIVSPLVGRRILAEIKLAIAASRAAGR